MKTKLINKLTPITIFLSITFALSTIFYFLIIKAESLNIPRVFGLMWCPGIAAIITLKLLKRNLSELGWKWGKTKYQIWSFIIPFLLVLISYVIAWSFDLAKFTSDKFTTGITPAIIGFILGLLLALGEEIGWRGFLAPELYKKLGFTKTAIISGLIWGVWHLPVILFADYNSGTPIWYAISNFMFMVISISFVFTWFRIKSGSLWTAVILHASFNLFIQDVFPLLTKNTESSAYYVGEFGVFPPIIAIILALYFWKKRDGLTKSVSTN